MAWCYDTEGVGSSWDMAAVVSLSCLPIKLQVAGHDLIIQPIKKEKVAEAYQLVCAEAKLGQDVGMDQYGSEEHLRCHLKTVPSFSISEAITGKLYAIIVIAPSIYSRSIDTVIADGLIICDAKVKSHILRTLVQATQSLGTDIGYEGLLIEAFRGSAFVPVLGTEGFTVIGCIPNSGKLMNRGWTDSVVTYKDLQPSKNKEQCPSNQLQPPSKILNKDWCPILTLVQKPCLTYLPCRYSLPTGKEVNLRYIQEGDIPHVYEMYKKSSEQAQGYATDEFESMEIFRFFVIDHGHAFVLEDPVTSTILVQISIMPSSVCHSVDPINVDCYAMVNQNFQGRQLGSEGIRLTSRLILDLGYKAVVGDCIAENFRMLHILRKHGQLVTAHIPKAVNGKDGKLEDLLIMYKDLEDKSKFVAKL